MRMVYNVIDKIIACIPDKEKEKKGQYNSLVVELNQIREAAMYKAPEQMPQYFQMVSNSLNTHLGEPDTDWKRLIGDIFADRIRL